jgi:hypothetical protein
MILKLKHTDRGTKVWTKAIEAKEKHAFRSKTLTWKASYEHLETSFAESNMHKSQVGISCFKYGAARFLACNMI